MKSVILIFTILAAITSMPVEADPSIVHMYLEKTRTLELDSIPPWPEGRVIKGANQHWQKELHGGEFTVVIYESMRALIDVNEPFPYDECVVVLEGEVTLTDLDRRTQT